MIKPEKRVTDQVDYEKAPREVRKLLKQIDSHRRINKCLNQRDLINDLRYMQKHYPDWFTKTKAEELR